MLQGKPMAEHGERGLVGWGRERVVMTHLVRVICRLCSTTGWKLRILGYRSIGLRVPEVMITLWNLANTGFTAKLASRQLSYRAYHCIGSLSKAREEKTMTCNRWQCMCNTVKPAHWLQMPEPTCRQQAPRLAVGTKNRIHVHAAIQRCKIFTDHVDVALLRCKPYGEGNDLRRHTEAWGQGVERGLTIRHGRWGEQRGRSAHRRG